MGSRKQNWDWGSALHRKLMEADARVRNFGASALDLCYVAAGKVDAVMYGGVGLRDIVPAVGILRAVGGDIYVFETGEVAPLTEEPQRVVASRTEALAKSICTL
jgi:fructose-1,6-bisphosphatase/inositol monophosphatase family enzyme